MELTDNQKNDLKLLKAHYPYRIVWCAKHPVTNDFQCGASATKRYVNDLVRKGYEGATV